MLPTTFYGNLKNPLNLWRIIASPKATSSYSLGPGSVRGSITGRKSTTGKGKKNRGDFLVKLSIYCILGDIFRGIKNSQLYIYNKYIVIRYIYI